MPRSGIPPAVRSSRGIGHAPHGVKLPRRVHLPRQTKSDFHGNRLVRRELKRSEAVAADNWSTRHPFRTVEDVSNHKWGTRSRGMPEESFVFGDNGGCHWAISFNVEYLYVESFRWGRFGVSVGCARHRRGVYFCRDTHHSFVCFISSHVISINSELVFTRSCFWRSPTLPSKATCFHWASASACHRCSADDLGVIVGAWWWLVSRLIQRKSEVHGLHVFITI